MWGGRPARILWLPLATARVPDRPAGGGAAAWAGCAGGEAGPGRAPGARSLIDGALRAAGAEGGRGEEEDRRSGGQRAGASAAAHDTAAAGGSLAGRAVPSAERAPAQAADVARIGACRLPPARIAWSGRGHIWSLAPSCRAQASPWPHQVPAGLLVLVLSKLKSAPRLWSTTCDLSERTRLLGRLGPGKEGERTVKSRLCHRAARWANTMAVQETHFTKTTCGEVGAIGLLFVRLIFCWAGPDRGSTDSIYQIRFYKM